MVYSGFLRVLLMLRMRKSRMTSLGRFAGKRFAEGAELLNRNAEFGSVIFDAFFDALVFLIEFFEVSEGISVVII